MIEDDDTPEDIARLLERKPRLASPALFAEDIGRAIARVVARGRNETRQADVLRGELVGAFGVAMLLRFIGIARGPLLVVKGPIVGPGAPLASLLSGEPLLVGFDAEVQYLEVGDGWPEWPLDPAAVRVWIRRASDGLVRVYLDDSWKDPDADAVRWQWSEGNYGCDCNRALFFARAGGEPDPDVECSDGRYRVEKIVDATGVVVYSEA